MRVEVLESIPERRAAEAKDADDVPVKVALLNFQSATEGESAFLESRRTGNLQTALLEDGRATCFGGFLLSFRSKEFGGDRSLHFHLIQKLIELLKNAGSAEILAAKLSLVSEKPDESIQGIFGLRIEIEAIGDSSEQATLRWGLGLAHLQQALLFTCRSLRHEISQKSG